MIILILKRLLPIFWLSLLFVFPSLSAQETFYFQFRIDCGHGNWQDTALLAATTDSALAAEVRREIELPLLERRHINGMIAHGDGGYNHNQNHRFRWHFVPDEWILAEISVEVCSGCPFTDLDTDPGYWVDTLGFFCPWSAVPVREVDDVISDVPEPASPLAFDLFPNPTAGLCRVVLPEAGHAIVFVRDYHGRTVRQLAIEHRQATLDLSGLRAGIYSVSVLSGRRRGTKKLVLLH